jgi:hypothetical protein
MTKQPTLKFIGAAIVAAAFSTGALAQTSSTPGAASDGAAPTSGASSKSSDKMMRKHKAEKDHGSKANPNARELKDGPMGTAPGGNGGATGGSAGAGASGGAGGAGGAGAGSQ